MASILTPLQMIAGATLSNNAGVTVAPAFSNAISNLHSTTLLTPLYSSNGVFGNYVAANIGDATIASIEIMAANSVPALADNTPEGVANAVGLLLGNATLGNSTTGFTGIISDIGNEYLGNGNVTVFAQVFSQAQSYIKIANDFINTAINSQTYLGSTFTTMNSLITGNLTDVTLATDAFGGDLSKLGNLINLDNLGNFGTPAALLQQISTITNLSPSVRSKFIASGISNAALEDALMQNATVSDSVQRLMYQVMKNIKGTDLEQILIILNVTTTGIETMADLLNPVKLFPNSFPSLTVRTYNQGTSSLLRAIYNDSQGTINSKLLEYLPRYILTVVPS